MAYKKSVINININFENDEQSIPHLPKPFLMRRDRSKGKLGTIQPSLDAQRTAIEIHKRVMEVQKFRRDSQSALEAPLLVTALIKKTHQRLDTIQVSTSLLHQINWSLLTYNIWSHLPRYTKQVCWLGVDSPVSYHAGKLRYIPSYLHLLRTKWIKRVAKDKVTEVKSSFKLYQLSEIYASNVYDNANLKDKETTAFIIVWKY